ncbi:MAG: CrcB family protein [Sphingomonadales bacterium]|jgi:CrcB protein|nr:CrcB family protein [Sphingomonadales bacterium]MBK9002869.1 CrcB family protein [Sphingomonadales bacterium]MBK9268117.1 CrcB family protein [Sphingomonadales bacterium]MBP6433646.1 CrcB family protein [Sphingorhabdus sp.]
MQAYVLVMTGGAIGAAARYGLARTLSDPSGGWPWHTFIANVAGGLLMGLVAAYVVRSGAVDENIRLFAGVGILGGFTTFSAFSLEMAQMVERGELALAGGYALASVVLALLALFAGLVFGRAVFA